MKLSNNPRFRVLVLLAAMSLCYASFAQAQDKPAANESGDKTGTNPINFQRDIRLYNEYSWLNTAGDGTQDLTTLEFRTPFAGGKWQFRARTRFNSITADVNDDGIDDIDESGLGDTDTRPFIQEEPR